MLVRKHIQQLLSNYYKQPQNSVVGSIPSAEPISFRNILGEWHWRQIYRQIYKRQTGQWLTPVELFRPYFSRILGNYIASETRASNDVFEIVELGGGRGTNAFHILDHLMNAHPDVYNQLKAYIIIDSSPTLSALQRNVLIQDSDDEGAGRHASKIKLLRKDLMEVVENKLPVVEKSQMNTVFLAMELLDNLPHDKLKICPQGNGILQTELRTSEIDSSELEEHFYPLTDPLLHEMTQIQPLYIPSQNMAQKWIPSVACGMIQQLYQQRPNASLLLADFDWLPPPTLQTGSIHTRKSLSSDYEPLITDMNDIDHACYLTAPPMCDVLFPTDFPLLGAFVSSLLTNLFTCADKSSRATTSIRGPCNIVNIDKQRDFLLKFGDEEIKRTTSRWTGYNPLLQDFSNCSVLTVSRKQSNS